MANKNSTKYASDRQEKRVAKEISGKQVVASGSKWGSKGDVRDDLYLIECKTTRNKFYTLNINTWIKIQREAIKDGLRTPIMCVDLENGKTKLAIFNAGIFDVDAFAVYNGNYHAHKSVRIDESFIGKIILFDTKPEIHLQVCEWGETVSEICRGE